MKSGRNQVKGEMVKFTSKYLEFLKFMLIFALSYDYVRILKPTGFSL